jgi:hypothetical protein
MRKQHVYRVRFPLNLCDVLQTFITPVATIDTVEQDAQITQAEYDYILYLYMISQRYYRGEFSLIKFDKTIKTLLIGDKYIGAGDMRNVYDDKSDKLIIPINAF